MRLGALAIKTLLIWRIDDMNSNETLVNIKDTTANPGLLGLLAFGMTTVLLNFHNAGFFGLGTMIMVMGVFYGGSAQVIAGIMEFKKGNTFGTTAFISYGFFWLSLVGIWVFPLDEYQSFVLSLFANTEY